MEVSVCGKCYIRKQSSYFDRCFLRNPTGACYLMHHANAIIVQDVWVYSWASVGNLMKLKVIHCLF